MKGITLLLIVLLFNLQSPATNADKIINEQKIDIYHDTQTDTILISSRGIRNLVVTGQLWGFLKYHHPLVAKGKYNWDDELFKLIPKIISAKSDAELSQGLESFVDNLPNTIEITIKPDTNIVFLKANYGSLFDRTIITETLAKKLELILKHPPEGINHYVEFEPIGNAIFRNELGYESIKYPQLYVRILSLFRYWNMVNYYYPYRDDDKYWNRMLADMLPRFITAKNEQDYIVSVLMLLSCLKDSHAKIMSSNKALSEFRGTRSVPIKATFLEDQLVITGYFQDTLNVKQNFKIGDIIKSIDGISVDSLIQKFLPISPGSNLEAQLRDLPNSHLLRTSKSEFNMTIIRNGRSYDVKMPSMDRNDIDYLGRRLNINEQNKVFHLIDSGRIGYLNGRLYKNKSLPEIIVSLNKTKGVIIDMRGYPGDFMPNTLGNYLKAKKSAFAFSTIVDSSRPGYFVKGQIAYNGGSDNFYKGKVIVLVNSDTQSMSEYSVMSFQGIPNVKVIGSRTAGADGNVSDIVLPGGIKTVITGIGIYYPDYKETQRVGVKIDLNVTQKISNLLLGKDDLLEKAVSLINQK